MKKRLSHFAYNERSRSGWTLSIPPLHIFESTPIDHKKLLPMSPARLLPLSPVRTKGDEGGFEFDFSSCHHLEFLNEFLRHHTLEQRKSSRHRLNAFFRFGCPRFPQLVP